MKLKTHKPNARLRIHDSRVGSGQQGEARQNSHRRGYDHQWKLARKEYLEKSPLCLECKKVGRVEVATDVDHIIPHRGDMRLFWDRNNWQGLCHACHSAKTARGE